MRCGRSFMAEATLGSSFGDGAADDAVTEV